MNMLYNKLVITHKKSLSVSQFLAAPFWHKNREKLKYIEFLKKKKVLWKLLFEINIDINWLIK